MKISTSHRSGFTLIELVVITSAVLLLVAALIPLVSYKMMASNLDVARYRGKDIFVALTGANTEREPLGLPPLWPSDSFEGLNFKNSTDYFKWLYDEVNLGSDNWRPVVSARDYKYRVFAGAGVPVCDDGVLTAECNMWTIAKNVTLRTPDCIPLLVTRNIDASSLAVCVTTNTFQRRLRYDPEWITPFSDRAGVIIYRGGSWRKFRAKYASYAHIYRGNIFDLSGGANGVNSSHPLKYLTPVREVSLGEQAYAEGAERVARNQAGLARVLNCEYFTTKKSALSLSHASQR